MHTVYETSVTNIAYNNIKDLIKKGKLKPGDKINPRIIAEMMGFSNTPVTHALKKLLGEGIVEYKVRIGFFVKKFSDEEVIELLELRAALEGFAVRKLIENNIHTELDEVIEFWNKYKGKTEQDYISADAKFHEKIVLYSRNPKLIDIWMNIGFNGKSNQSGLKHTMTESQNQHKELVAAIKARDMDRAQSIMMYHFIQASKNVQEGKL